LYLLLPLLQTSPDDDGAEPPKLLLVDADICKVSHRLSASSLEQPLSST
jgi:hypothetical protein